LAYHIYNYIVNVQIMVIRLTAGRCQEIINGNKPGITEIMIDHIPDGLYMVDTEHKIIVWNQAMVKLTGISQMQAIGACDYRLTSPLMDARPGLVDLVLGTSSVLAPSYTNLTIEDGVYYADLRLRLKKSHTHWYSLRAIPVHAPSGQLTGVVCTVIDSNEDRKVTEARRIGRAHV